MNIRKFIHEKVNHLTLASVSGKLMMSNDPQTKRLGVVINRAMSKQWTPEDRERFAAIEAIRARMLADYTHVIIEDYGAGSQATGGATRKTITIATATQASKSAYWCQLLYALVKEYQPNRVIELGANVGISAAYIANALPSGARLHTLEGALALADIARQNLNIFDRKNSVVICGKFADELPNLIVDYGYQFAFIDGHHAAYPTVTYFNQIISAMPDGVIVFDDINWSKGMRAAWQVVVDHPRVIASADLRAIGVVVVGGYS
jgi:predicted O-methyltransferase YrrM